MLAPCAKRCAQPERVSRGISGSPLSPQRWPWCQLTEPFQARHPDVTFSVTSRTSLQVLSQLENLEIDAGITYLDNEPLGRVTTVPLYSERYHLITAAGTPLADREVVTWKEVSGLRLCLLTPDMQNRRIINAHMAEAGVQPSRHLNRIR